MLAYINKNKLVIIGALALAMISTMMTLRINLAQTVVDNFFTTRSKQQLLAPDANQPISYNTALEKDSVTGKYPEFWIDNNVIYDGQQIYQKSAQLDLVALEFDQYLRELKTYFNSIGGVMISSYTGLADQGSLRYATINLSVPSDKFDQSLMEIGQKASKVIGEQTQTENRTGQLISKQEQIAKLNTQITALELKLASTTNPVDALSLKSQLESLRTRLEKLEKQEQTIKQQADYSIVHLRIANHQRYFTGEPDYALSFKRELMKAWYSLINNLSTMIQFIIWLALYTLIWTPVILMVVLLQKKLIAKK